MNIFLTAVFAFVFIFLCVITGIFIYIFRRRSTARIGDLESSENKVLEPYKDTLRNGMKYINEAPHEWVFIESYDKLKLAARFFPCEDSGKNKNKVIILFHGYRSAGSRDYCCAVKMYHENGFNVLLIDQRSHGKSEGKLITFGVKESLDAVSWVKYICHRFGERTPIFLSGLSMGATTVMLATGRNLPKNVCGVVADCGFTSPAEIISLVARKNFHIKSVLLIRILDLMCRIVANFSLYEMSTEEILKKSDIPIMFIHGLEDGFVPCEMSIRSHKAAKAEKYIYLIEKATHGCSFLVEPQTISDALRKFFEKYGQ